MLGHFKEIWCVDFEFAVREGEPPIPVCIVAKELRTGRVIRLFGEQMWQRKSAPFNVGDDSLVVAFYASAELSCFKVLGWQFPAHILDLYAEFKTLQNGLRPRQGGFGLLSVMIHYKLDHLSAIEKKEMQELAARGEPFTAEEREALLDYCQSDVDALVELLPRMVPELDLVGRVCIRGGYMAPSALMENAGVPVDTPLRALLCENWEPLKLAMVEHINPQYNVFEGIHFRFKLFEIWLKQHAIDWPRTPTGRPAMDYDTMRDMGMAYPEIGPLHQLKATLGKMRLQSLAIGHDGRNRTMLSAFGASSGRNTPSSKKYIFGPAVWLRGLIRPAPGMALAYLDYSSEEFAIGAFLSKDPKMLQAYLTKDSDPYIEFAKMAGKWPYGATKTSHSRIRDLFKHVVLGVNYGMTAKSLAYRIGKPVEAAQKLLELYSNTFKVFWRWGDGAVSHAQFEGELHTLFGWYMHYRGRANHRSQRNFLLQANGAELLRLACCRVAEKEVVLIAPIHDAILVEAPIDRIKHDVAVAEAAMGEASREMFAGFEIKVDRKIVEW